MTRNQEAYKVAKNEISRVMQGINIESLAERVASRLRTGQSSTEAMIHRLTRGSTLGTERLGRQKGLLEQDSDLYKLAIILSEAGVQPDDPAISAITTYLATKGTPHAIRTSKIQPVGTFTFPPVREVPHFVRQDTDPQKWYHGEPTTRLKQGEIALVLPRPKDIPHRAAPIIATINSVERNRLRYQPESTYRVIASFGTATLHRYPMTKDFRNPWSNSISRLEAVFMGPDAIREGFAQIGMQNALTKPDIIGQYLQHVYKASNIS